MTANVARETLEAACNRIDKLEALLQKCAVQLQEHAEYNAGKPNSEMKVLILVNEILA